MASCSCERLNGLNAEDLNDVNDPNCSQKAREDCLFGAKDIAEQSTFGGRARNCPEPTHAFLIEGLGRSLQSGVIDDSDVSPLPVD